MPGSLVLLPLRLGLRATSLAVRGAREIVERAAELVGVARPEDGSPDFHAAPAGPPTRTEPPPRPVQTQTAAPPSAPGTASSPLQDRGEAIDYDAPISAEPWDGYRTLRATDIIGRLATASPEELAAIELYELSSRRRRTVIAAARRQLSRRR